MARFTKIGDEWGIKSDVPLNVGDELEITKRNGGTSKVKVAEHVAGELYKISRVEKIGFFPIDEVAGKKVWGIRVPKSVKAKCGDEVTIVTKAGRIATKRLGVARMKLDTGATVYEVAKEDE